MRDSVWKFWILVFTVLLVFSATTVSGSDLQNSGPTYSSADISSETFLQSGDNTFENSPRVTVTASRSSKQSVAEFEWSFDIPSETDKFGVYVSEGHVVSMQGFSSESEEGVYTWDGRTEAPSLHIAKDIGSGDSGGFDGQEYAATEDWMFAPVPLVGITWYNNRYSGWQAAVPMADNSFERLSRNVEGTGVLGRRSVYLGAYTEHSQMGDGQRFRLVIPASATLAESPNEVLAALTDASDFMVGTVHEEILIFALPDPMRKGGAATSQTGEFWVHSGSPLDSPNNVWFHEYMHTRQTYNLSSNMEWFTEASAEYHAASLTRHQDRISTEEGLRYLTRDRYDNEVLSNPDSWSSQQVPYYKGSSVLLALDDQIRTRTDDQRWLGHVIYQMHLHEGPITYSDFKRIVADVAGESLDAWLDRYVTTSEAPPVDGYRSFSGETATQTQIEGDSSTDGSRANDSPINQESDGDDSTVSDAPAGSASNSSSHYLVNAIVGGIAGYWIWNREENRNNDQGFAIGLAISSAFLMNLLLGALGLLTYYYLVKRRTGVTGETADV